MYHHGSKVYMCVAQPLRFQSNPRSTLAVRKSDKYIKHHFLFDNKNVYLLLLLIHSRRKERKKFELSQPLQIEKNKPSRDKKDKQTLIFRFPFSCLCLVGILTYQLCRTAPSKFMFLFSIPCPFERRFHLSFFLHSTAHRLVCRWYIFIFNLGDGCYHGLVLGNLLFIFLFPSPVL